MGTRSLLPLGVQLRGEDRVLELPEESLQHVGHILDEVVTDAQLDVAGIPAELLHQHLDPGLGPILPVNAFMSQPCGQSKRETMSWEPRAKGGARISTTNAGVAQVAD